MPIFQLFNTLPTAPTYSSLLESFAHFSVTTPFCNNIIYIYIYIRGTSLLEYLILSKIIFLITIILMSFPYRNEIAK